MWGMWAFHDKAVSPLQERCSHSAGASSAMEYSTASTGAPVTSAKSWHLGALAMRQGMLTRLRMLGYPGLADQLGCLEVPRYGAETEERYLTKVGGAHATVPEAIRSRGANGQPEGNQTHGHRPIPCTPWNLVRRAG